MSGHLLLGLTSGYSAGDVSVAFDLYANGQELLQESFATGAAAAGYFTDHAVDLGALSGVTWPGGVLDLDVRLTVTGASAQGGFYGGLVVAI